LNAISIEMSKEKITAQEFDKAKSTVKSWVSDYEKILEKSMPYVEERNR